MCLVSGMTVRGLLAAWVVRRTADMQSPPPMLGLRMTVVLASVLPYQSWRHGSDHVLPRRVQEKPAVAADPFESLPFKGLADRLGEAFMPVVQVCKASNRFSTS